MAAGLLQPYQEGAGYGDFASRVKQAERAALEYWSNGVVEHWRGLPTLQYLVIPLSQAEGACFYISTWDGLVLNGQDLRRHEPANRIS
jgi:hypothetical protein